MSRLRLLDTPGKGEKSSLMTYWCYICNTQVSKNCGHEDYGAGYTLRDLTPGKGEKSSLMTYWCRSCNA